MRTNRRVSGRVVLAVGFCCFCRAGLVATESVEAVAVTLVYVEGVVKA
jgi:hypothetical protein